MVDSFRFVVRCESHFLVGHGGIILYRELLEKLIGKYSYAKLQNPCTEDKLRDAEQAVGYAFPEELKCLLRETDGDHWLILSCEEIIKNVTDNREIFSDYLTKEEIDEKINRFIFFATNGCGDYYCYKCLPDGNVDASGIYIWDHETFETRKVSETLVDLINKYYNNEI